MNIEAKSKEKRWRKLGHQSSQFLKQRQNNTEIIHNNYQMNDEEGKHKKKKKVTAALIHSQRSKKCILTVQIIHTNTLKIMCTLHVNINIAIDIN